MNAHVAGIDLLPSSLDAERALLGAVLLNNDAYLYVADIVEAEHFFDPLHTRIFEVVGHLIAAGKIANPITLQQFLPADVTREYLAHVAAEATSVVLAPEYAHTIHELWQRRRIMAFARELQGRAALYDDAPEIGSVLDEADAELSAIRFGKNIDGVVTLQQALTASVDLTARAYQGNGSVGLTTGIPAVDEMIGPMMPGDLVTVLGASGHGKSAVAAQILNHNANQTLDTNSGGHPGLFFSMEMESAQIARRLIAAVTGVTMRAQRAGDILPAEFEFLVDAARQLGPRPILIDQTPGQTVSKLIRKARAIKKRHNIAIVAIDHLLEIRPDNPRWSRIETVENAVRELKRLAKELQVVILLLAQATREGQKREHWRLRTNDIYGGDAVKQSSDMVLSLAIPSVWLAEREPEASDQKAHDKWAKQSAEWAGKAEIGAPKVRDGESGGWRTLKFDGKRTLFEDR